MSGSSEPPSQQQALKQPTWRSEPSTSWLRTWPALAIAASKLWLSASAAESAVNSASAATSSMRDKSMLLMMGVTGLHCHQMSGLWWGRLGVTQHIF